MIAFGKPGPMWGVGPLSVGINLASLALLIWGITTEVHPGLGGRHLATLVLLAVAVLGWLGWTATRSRTAHRLGLASLALMAVAGGALAAFAGLAVTFVGVAALGATMDWSLKTAAWIAAGGPLAMLMAVGASGDRFGVVLAGLAAALAGTVMGINRRQAQERAARDALVEVTEARAQAERARAELLAARNHLGRELHDVLAHTLSALSVQLEALDALVSAQPVIPEVRQQLERTKRLVRDGMDEARGAVRALREDASPLETQLDQLAAERHARLDISGSPRRLAPDVSLVLYRIAQEALTNVVKHAPGADAQVTLCFEQERVTLTVANDRSRCADGSPLAGSGGGYGLQGIRERILLIGGVAEAGPTAGGWLVKAGVPA